MHSYHKSSVVDHAHNLHGPLHELIKNIAQGKHGVGSADYSSLLSVVDKYRVPHSQPAQHHIVNTKQANELSRYFKQRGYGSTLEPGIDVKLKQSTWHHIHFALRLARQSNIEGAGIHADIAFYACKELAHYLSEQEYCEFIVEIQNELKQLEDISLHS